MTLPLRVVRRDGWVNVRDGLNAGLDLHERGHQPTRRCRATLPIKERERGVSKRRPLSGSRQQLGNRRACLRHGTAIILAQESGDGRWDLRLRDRLDV